LLLKFDYGVNIQLNKVMSLEAHIHWALTILVEAAGIEPASVSPLPKALHA